MVVSRILHGVLGLVKALSEWCKHHSYVIYDVLEHMVEQFERVFIHFYRLTYLQTVIPTELDFEYSSKVMNKIVHEESGPSYFLNDGNTFDMSYRMCTTTWSTNLKWFSSDFTAQHTSCYLAVSRYWTF